MTADASKDSAGGKSIGLFALRDGWTPTFVVLPDELHSIFQTLTTDEHLRDAVSADLHQHLVATLHTFGDNPEDIPLIVRSDAIDEGLSERGRFSSHASDATVDGVLDAAEQIFTEAGNHSRRIGLIVQRSVSAQVSGHFSNELRIRKDARRWLCEMVNGPFADTEDIPTQKSMWIEDATPAEAGALRCNNRAEILGTLRSVGKYFYDQRLRRHLEWVWDGSRVWIVQNDADEVIPGEVPTVNDISPRSNIDVSELEVLSVFQSDIDTPWQKLQCVRDFATAGMPVTPLYFAAGDVIKEHLAGGNASNSLSQDLTLLLGQPLVIRTDVRGETAFLLPRTDTVRNVESATTFMQRVIQAASLAGRPLSDLCFIIHRFIPAAASAFSLARPGNRRVRIDAMWGLPDGLEFCTHDSYEIDSKSSKLLEKRVRYKSTFLANLPTGEWKAEPLASPYNWRECLSLAELQRIASASQLLAEQKGKAVVVMWFAGIPKGSGHPELLPWRLTMEDAPREVAASGSSHFFGASFPIRNSADLQLLAAKAPGISSVILRPDGPHLRDESFLTQLADVAAALKLRIDLDGSFLSHAYYVLKRAGANVACIDPIDPPPVKTRFLKLVRDRIPVKIERSGEKAETYTLLKPDLLEVLKTKLVEESLEVLSATNHLHLREEMADVYEVIRAMCHVLGCAMAEVKKDADEKKIALGGFQDGVILMETKDMPLITVDEDSALFTSASSSKKIDVQQIISVAGRKAKSQIDRIVLPLVPPVPTKHRGAIRVEIRQLGAQFRIVYGEKSVEVILDGRRRPSRKGQMNLFPSPVTRTS